MHRRSPGPNCAVRAAETVSDARTASYRYTGGVLARASGHRRFDGATAAAKAATASNAGCDAVGVAAGGGPGQPHGFLSMLAVREDTGMDIVGQSLPHMPEPKLPSGPASEFIVPDLYPRASEDECSSVRVRSMDIGFRGLYRAGAFGAVVERSNKTAST